MLTRIIAAIYRSMTGALLESMPFAGMPAPALGSISEATRNAGDPPSATLTKFLPPAADHTGDQTTVEPGWKGQWQILRYL